MSAVLAAVGLVIAALVLAVALMAAVGASLPRDHVASRSARFDVPPETLFDLLSDPAARSAWHRGAVTVESKPIEGKPGFVERSRHEAIAFVIEESERPKRWVTRIADPSLPFGGRWIHVIEPDARGCVLTITEEGSVKNVLFRFLSRFVFGHTATMDRVLASLARYVASAAGNLSAS